MIINFGSINLDHVYRVKNLPKPGETMSAQAYERYLGGKGINQSIAISKAGGDLLHVGAIGKDDDWTLSQIKSFGIGSDCIARLDTPTGHAIIYVDSLGENEIVILGGANQALKIEQVELALAQGNSDNDWILLQNETNLVKEIVSMARARSFKIAYAAAPFAPETTLALLDDIDLLAVNEGEANQLSKALGKEICDIPVDRLLVTRGADGAEFFANGSRHVHAAFDVSVVDTTGAGDTFLGSFLAHYANNQSPDVALRYASAASALQVTKSGAATAIPENAEVLEFLKKQSEI